MLEVLLWFIPSLIGLVLVLFYMIELMKIARERRSIAFRFIFSIWFSFVSVILSWFVVLAIAIEQVNRGHPIISWQVLLLPVGWGFVAWFINYLIRR
jgi:uncharacterized membrane protein